MQIEYFIMDVDGTLTDGKIYMSPTGEAMKAFCIKDGCGIHDLLLTNNIQPIIVTGRESEIVIQRCNELGIKRIYQNVVDKNEILCSVIKDLSKVAYIGDDLNDISFMKNVKCNGGIVGCPADAIEKVKELADFVAPHDGGNGAVRDFIDYVLDHVLE